MKFRDREEFTQRMIDEISKDEVKQAAMLMILQELRVQDACQMTLEQGFARFARCQGLAGVIDFQNVTGILTEDHEEIE